MNLGNLNPTEQEILAYLIQRRLNNVGIRPQTTLILEAPVEHIMDTFGQSRATVFRVLQKFEKEGYIETVNDERKLTAKGWVFFDPRVYRASVLLSSGKLSVYRPEPASLESHEESCETVSEAQKLVPSPENRVVPQRTPHPVGVGSVPPAMDYPENETPPRSDWLLHRGNSELCKGYMYPEVNNPYCDPLDINCRIAKGCGVRDEMVARREVAINLLTSLKRLKGGTPPYTAPDYVVPNGTKNPLFNQTLQLQEN